VRRAWVFAHQFLGGYFAMSGTSMATPHVAGLVALLISSDPSLAGDVDRIEEIIRESARPKTSSQQCGDSVEADIPNPVFGWGIIDALAAICPDCSPDGGADSDNEFVRACTGKACLALKSLFPLYTSKRGRMNSRQRFFTINMVTSSSHLYPSND